MGAYHIAVLDIGKTNKKIMIFNPELKLLEAVKTSIGEDVRDGINFEDTDKLLDWFRGGLKDFAARYDIRVISITTHGATYGTVDADGRRAMPVVAYTTDPGEDFHQKFFAEFGDPDELQKETATANFSSLLNLGKNLAFVRGKYPAEFNNIKHILNYPQFFGYMLTGKAGAENTFTGCHTYMWNFDKWQWSSVADKLGVKDKLPAKISNPWDVLGTITADVAARTGLKDDVIVTMGIHDSNSSLLPYNIAYDQDFVLDSTGTWCVCMHEEDKVDFSDEDLGKAIFYNLNSFGAPVKTSIFLGGMEFETWTDILKEINSTDSFPDFDPAVCAEVLEQKNLFIFPGVIKGLGQFPESEARVYEDGEIYSLEEIKSGKRVPAFFKDYNKAYAVLNLSLAVQTRTAFERIKVKDGLTIFIEGGFRNNSSYLAMLSSFYPDSEVYLTGMEEATAFGAAILGKAAMDKISPKDMKDLITIEKKAVDTEKLTGIEDYYREFLRKI